jgi:aldehyde dehydrogenase (NAD+)
MPHWVDGGVRTCVEGTPGAAPPPALAPRPDELVVPKQFFTGFVGSTLDEWFRARDVGAVVVAGVFLHGCVRATVLDAYERGYEVVVADDAVGEDDAVHGAVSRQWLEGRAASFRSTTAIVASAGGVAPTETESDAAAEVRAAAQAATAAQRQWSRTTVGHRIDVLERWAATIERDAGALADAVVAEVGKPRSAAVDEIGRAVAHVRSTTALLRGRFGSDVDVADGVAVRHRPVGTFGLVLPWNNPVALLVGKVAPAIGFGNAVIVKPAPEGSASARAVLDSLATTGIPPGVVQVVLGGREAAEALCDDPGVDAVSVTGSIATGRAIAARCARLAKPVQAELGGNNAAVVLAEADLEEAAQVLARSAFGFAGQRCTAIRRFVVETSVHDRFEELVRSAADAMVVGDPRDPATEVGPLVSVAARDRVLAVIEAAVADGARVVTGGTAPPGFEDGAWLAPTVLADVDPASRVAQEETFGPVAVLLRVADAEEAVTVANGVVQGLVAAVFPGDAPAVDEVHAGMVQLGAGPLAIHADAPFLGWKASGLGPPEHGEWDAAFYARPQALYGKRSC